LAAAALALAATQGCGDNGQLMRVESVSGLKLTFDEWADRKAMTTLGSPEGVWIPYEKDGILHFQQDIKSLVASMLGKGISKLQRAVAVVDKVADFSYEKLYLGTISKITGEGDVDDNPHLILGKKENKNMFDDVGRLLKLHLQKVDGNAHFNRWDDNNVHITDAKTTTHDLFPGFKGMMTAVALGIKRNKDPIFIRITRKLIDGKVEYNNTHKALEHKIMFSKREPFSDDTASELPQGAEVVRHIFVPQEKEE
jgi:hypothetical protein